MKRFIKAGLIAVALAASATAAFAMPRVPASAITTDASDAVSGEGRTWPWSRSHGPRRPRSSLWMGPGTRSSLRLVTRSTSPSPLMIPRRRPLSAASCDLTSLRALRLDQAEADRANNGERDARAARIYGRNRRYAWAAISPDCTGLSVLPIHGSPIPKLRKHCTAIYRQEAVAAGREARGSERHP